MSRKTQKKASKNRDANWRWGALTLALIALVALLRLAINALDLVPIHFDEGQYWAYGQELAAGHFSKPPLVGWLIQFTTSLGGDTSFALRVGSIVCHGLIAFLLFLCGTWLWDGRTGFWAAAGYTAAPGVTASAMIMSTDPVMMTGWALALYAWIRAAEGGARIWWAVLGGALGLAMLAKYTALAFAAGAVGYALFSARGRDVAGVLTAVVVGLLVFSPNIAWNIAYDFATVTHVAEDARPGGTVFNPDKLAEFLGAQIGVIGPIWFAAILIAPLGWRGWVGDWRMRLLAWQTYPLLLAMIGLSFVTRAQPNWAAPAYIAGSLIAARAVLSYDWRRGGVVQLGVGAVAAILLYGAAAAYAIKPLDLPRAADPFKKMRLAEPFCERAMAAMAEEGADVLLSNDRRRLSECMFLGGLGWEEIAVWNPDMLPNNHHELVATLNPGDERPMLLAMLDPALARQIAGRFEIAREIDGGAVQTHADRSFTYTLWVVQGFRGY